MREYLIPFHGRRITVQGIFARFIKHSDIQTALFQALEHNGEFLCSHSYVQHADTMLAYDLVFGEKVQFSATVIQYKKKTFGGYSLDYSLTHPTSVITLDRKVVLPSLILEGEQEDFIREEAQPKLSRTDLAGELERLAMEAGGYEQLQAALDFLRH